MPDFKQAEVLVGQLMLPGTRITSAHRAGCREIIQLLAFLRSDKRSLAEKVKELEGILKQYEEWLEREGIEPDLLDLEEIEPDG